MIVSSMNKVFPAVANNAVDFANLWSQFSPNLTLVIVLDLFRQKASTLTHILFALYGSLLFVVCGFWMRIKRE